MRLAVYNFLVNRHPGIRQKYHNYHDRAHGYKNILSWIYLILLNVICFFTIGHYPKQVNASNSGKHKKLPLTESESMVRFRQGKSVDDVVSELMKYDIVSFDIFDTLIFRPFSAPTDLFYLMGNEIGLLDFKRIREDAEYTARIEKYTEFGTYEVNFRDIWLKLSEMIDISVDDGMALEHKYELEFCYANPFMKKVFDKLIKSGKRVVITSDMYLSKAFLEELLHGNGYTGFERLYVSCEYDKSKSDGRLYDVVLSEMQIAPEQMIHVGDNEHSDVKIPKRRGISSCYYPNINKHSIDYRANEISSIIGGAYRGIVNNHIYNGISGYSREYEYGYIYGGIFAMGYCCFIHDYVRKNCIDKVLFLSRDGDILKQVYEKLFPNEAVEYAYWSRKAATKLMANGNRYDFFRRFLYHKVNQKITVKKIFDSMELADMLAECHEVNGNDYLTNDNAAVIKSFLVSNWERVLHHYENEHKAAKLYYGKLIGDSKKIAVIDIGWAGSGAMSLRYLFEKEWDINCEVIGVIAGTNTVHNAEADASDSFLQSGELVSYLYSFAHNRNLMKQHDLNKDYNVYWELLLSSPTPQFMGFSMDDGKYGFRFGRLDANQSGIMEIQKGILDFVEQYQCHFGNAENEKFSYMYNISGSDAYAPMLVAAEHDECYLKMINSLFDLQVNVN